MKVFSAVEWVDGAPRPRRIYGIEIVAPDKSPVLCALSLDKIAIEEYLVTCQKTSKPEHWRIIELEVNHDGTN